MVGWGVENIVQEYTCSLAEGWLKACWKMNFLYSSVVMYCILGSFRDKLRMKHDLENLLGKG